MRILVVDDSRAMRLLVRRALRQAGAHHDVREAEDAVTALAAVAADRPDLVLSDWELPGTSGIDLLRALRATGDPVRFGFISSTSTPAVRNLADEAGALFLIAKPFTAEAFAQALRTALVRRG